MGNNIMIPEWLEVINNPVKNKDGSNLKILIYSIMDQLEQEGPNVTNDFLKQVQIEYAHPSLLVAIISSSFSYRNSMPEWFILRDRMVKQFVAQGKNIKSLKGLL